MPTHPVSEAYPRRIQEVSEKSQTTVIVTVAQPKTFIAVSTKTLGFCVATEDSHAHREESIVPRLMILLYLDKPGIGVDVFFLS